MLGRNFDKIKVPSKQPINKWMLFGLINENKITLYIQKHVSLEILNVGRQ